MRLGLLGKIVKQNHSGRDKVYETLSGLYTTGPQMKEENNGGRTGDRSFVRIYRLR
jgi:hypothetical protein